MTSLRSLRWFRWYTNHCRICLDVVHHHSARANLGTLTDSNVLQHLCSRSYQYAVLQDYTARYICAWTYHAAATNLYLMSDRAAEVE